MTIEEICKRYDIKNYTINPDGTIDVDGGVFLYDMNLEELPLSFNKVSGYFDCGRNKLTSLKGCPEKIGKEFRCFNTPLSSIFNRADQFFLHAFNFYRVIKDDTVNLKRLRYVMDLYDQPIDLEKIEKYYRIV